MTVNDTFNGRVVQITKAHITSCKSPGCTHHMYPILKGDRCFSCLNSS
jgi:hypothetical protein